MNEENETINNVQLEPNIIQTDLEQKDGQNKCLKCGATDISLNVKTGMLRCNFCRYEFKPKAFDVLEKNIFNLKGDSLGSGAKDIIADTKDMITLKCTSCGAEVIVDT